jgi:RES domain-containing protein
VIVWRLALNKKYNAADTSGAGAKSSGGRWNHQGTPVLYCGDSQALCILENLVHKDPTGLPLYRHMVEVDIPDLIWKSRKVLRLAAAPVGWDLEPAGPPSKDYGTNWLTGMSSAVLLVPSAISPADCSVLVNPLHPDASKIKATDQGPFRFDLRLF